MLRARPQLPIPVDVIEVAAETAAVESTVEGGTTGHCGWVDGCVGGRGCLVRVEGCVGGEFGGVVG